MKRYNDSDYSINNLPKNRKELFYDILRNNINYIIYLGIIILLSFLPYIIFNYINLVSITTILNSNDLNKETLLQAYYFKDIINIPLLLIIGIVMSGVYKIIKHLLYNEGFIFKKAFFQGIKENKKDFLMSFILLGIILLLLDIIAVNFIFINSIVYYLMNILKFIILLPLFMVLFSLCSIYSDNLLKKIKTAFIIVFKHYLKIMLLVLLELLPLSLLFINNGYVTIFVSIFYLFLYIPLVLIYIGNVLNGIFDKEINKFYFKEIVNKGLFID